MAVCGLFAAMEPLEHRGWETPVRELLEWLEKRQLSSGALPQWDGSRASLLGTARGVRAWLEGGQWFGEERYTEAAVRAGRWLVGSLLSLEEVPIASFYALDPLSALARRTGERSFLQATRQLAERASAWIQNPSDPDAELSASALGELGWGLRAVLRWHPTPSVQAAYDQLVRKALDALRMDGLLPGRFSARLEPLPVEYMDVRGALLLAHLWEEKYQQQREFPFRHAALRTLELVARLQSLRTRDAGRYGAVPAFLPPDRGPAPFSFPTVTACAYLFLLLRLLGANP
ncbi:MAG: hypothetical protein KatS3mg115_2463 [Candidatus Poribacteria bacterium]|nr:MAG: hypothetical protein KatS3mg115_2463 [Candidatus Poribacteria bacterium]